LKLESKEYSVSDICKVTSGSTLEVPDRVDSVYAAIISFGTFKAVSIKVAEAAKVIENVQRDLNIALVNELAQIFGAMDIDTNDVLDAAASKWNFANYRPGLVGGRCIGVDPYCLTFKAQELNLCPELVLSGRRTNKGMSSYLAQQIVQLMVTSNIALTGSKVLVLGTTFKPNCNDIRNTKVPDMIVELKKFGLSVDLFDPEKDQDEIKSEYGLQMTSPQPNSYDAVILAVPHDPFVQSGSENLRSFGKEKYLLIDPWSAFSSDESDFRV
jgi:UDP-N-acetyl-D-glucosamine/UDP-N-acetyl-D-galactosamine dehydrogenase